MEKENLLMQCTECYSKQVYQSYLDDIANNEMHVTSRLFVDAFLHTNNDDCELIKIYMTIDIHTKCFTIKWPLKQLVIIIS